MRISAHRRIAWRKGRTRAVTVVLGRASSQDLDIPITVSRGSAESTDYTVLGLTSGDLPVSAGDTSATFTIRTRADLDDDDETVNLSFGTLPDGVAPGTTSSATVAIEDDVSATFGLSSYSVEEGSDRTVAVVLSKARCRPLDIPITVTRDRAESGDHDVVGLTSSGRLTFSAGDRSKTFTIEANEDTDNDDETLDLEFGSLPSGVVAGTTASATVTISDDEDATVTFGSSAYNVNEGEDVSVTVSLDGERSHSLIVPVTVSNDTAENGDYSVVGLTNGRLTFGAWETSASFTVEADEDTDNDDEIVDLGFGTLPFGVVEGSTPGATVTIDETNVPPKFDEVGSPTRTVAENTASNTDVGIPVSATDDDGHTLTYSLSGTDQGSFSIIERSGQIRTSASLDFETKDSYSVIVTADDDNGGTASIDVTINVTDVNEAPVGSAISDRTLASNVASLEIDLSIYFSDPDTNDTLSYNATSDAVGVATVGVNGTALTLTAVSGGTVNITVTAADRPSGNADRLMISQTFAAIVADRPPDQPAGLKAEAMIGGRGIELEWGRADGAVGYEVEIAPNPTVDAIDITGLKAEVTGLTPGTVYTFKVLACNPCGASGLYSLPSIPVDFEAPEPTNSGHQADHVVKYVVDPLGNSVISGAIEPAVNAWNFAMTRLGKGLNICMGTGCVNPDGYTARIKTVDNKNDALDNPEDSDGFDEGCGPSRACVKSVPNGDHRENLYMIFEDPPWFAQKDANDVWRSREYVWTKYKYKNGKLIPCLAAATPCAARYYVYVDRIMLHEFGHTLGLKDFYNDTETGLNGYLNGVKLPNAAMLKNAVMDTGFVINGEDIKQLEAVYLLHDPH